MTERISVALTTYNGERFLAEQIDSLLAQDRALHEIVVCDDCSKDSTREILRDYATRFPLIIKVYENERNLGYIRNFEKAISQCTGDYIALCDQDDVWDHNKARELVSAIGDADAIHSDARLIDSSGNVLADSFSSFAGKKVRRLGFLDLFMNNTVTGCTLMFRRSLLQPHSSFPDCLPHDHWIALLATDRNGLVYYPHALLSYRQHDANVLGAGTGKRDSPQKNNSGRTRKDISRDRIRTIERLMPIAEVALSKKNSKELRSLLNYYQSYFRTNIRPSALWFYLAHLRSFARNKSVARILYGMAYAFCGKKYSDE